MYPNLLEAFRDVLPAWLDELPAYFAMLVLGYGVAIYVTQRQGRRMGLDHDTLIDLGLYSLVWGVIGGRLLHVFADGYFWDYVHLCTDPSLVEWRITEERCARAGGAWDPAALLCMPVERDCFAWAKFWRGGLAYYGGLFAAAAFGVRFLKKEKFPLAKGIDLVGLTLPIGLFFGRLGCFLGGCCFGSRCAADALGSVRFPAWSAASEAQWQQGWLTTPDATSLPVHAAQLYEALGCLIIAAIGMLVVRPRKRFDGQVMLVFLALYAVLRFGLEFVRADARGSWFGLSTSQWLGLVVLAAVGVLFHRAASSARRDAKLDPPEQAGTRG